MPWSFFCTHTFNMSTSDFNAKLTAMEHILKVLSYHGQIDAQISTNSCQIRPKDPQEHKEKLQAPCYSKFSRMEMITRHEMRQFQQPHHYTVCQWRFYPIVKTLYLYATCKFSNHLTLEQWAFEYGLPFFWYALYTKKTLADRPTTG